MVKTIDINILHDLLSYDAETGIFTWKTRTLSYCSSIDNQKRLNTRIAGKPAGYHHSAGYTCITLLGVAYLAHRIAWAMHYGTWPIAHIDHVDGDRKNNAISNLRDVTQAENNRNKRMQTNSTSGHQGVNITYSRKGIPRYRATIHSKNKKITLGTFDSIEEAVKARAIAEQNLGYHENHGKVK